VKRGADEPQSGLEWGSVMVEHIVRGEAWEDVHDARQEGTTVRVGPSIDRLELLELLAERAPDDGAARFLGAHALERYLGHDPDVARVEEAAERSERFRVALAAARYESKLSGEDVARLRRFGRR